MPDLPEISEASAYRILLVEDERSYSQLANTVLEGHQRLMAHDARRGLTLFLKKAPDITFLDIGLPDANGIEVLKAMRRLRRTAYIVMLTASRVSEDVQKAMASGANGYIVKPFSRGAVRDYLQKYRHYLRELPPEELLPPALSLREQADADRLLARFGLLRGVACDFPAEEPPAPGLSSASAAKQEPPTIGLTPVEREILAGWRVLFIDALPGQSQRFRHYLQQLGMQVDLAGSAAEALPMARENPYHLLLVATELPDAAISELPLRLRQDGTAGEIVPLLHEAWHRQDNRWPMLKIHHFLPRPVYLAQVEQLLQNLIKDRMSQWKAIYVY